MTNFHHHPVLAQNRVYRPKTAPPVRKVYGEQQQNSDNSDYGELRAIVRRIEMNQNESPTEHLTQPNSPIKKKLVFDYVPASVMMKR